MRKNRANPAEITPEYEDTGLYRAGVNRVTIHLVPLFRRNSRQDLVITGIVGESREVAVTFPGRRMPAAKPLIEHLEKQRAHLRRQAMMQGQRPPDVRLLRLPVQIEGTWRKTVVRDSDGWTHNTWELLAAQWTVVNSAGEPVSYGFPPLVRHNPATISGLMP